MIQRELRADIRQFGRMSELARAFSDICMGHNRVPGDPRTRYVVAYATSLRAHSQRIRVTVIVFGADEYTAGQLADGYERFLYLIENGLPSGSLQEEIVRYFHVYGFCQDDQPQKVLFTGYYEPLLRGSLTPDDIFRYPIYGRPGIW